MNKFFTLIFLVFLLLAADWVVGQEMVLVKDIGIDSESPEGRVVSMSEGKMFFSVNVGSFTTPHYELWHTDGTEEGTLQLHADLYFNGLQGDDLEKYIEAHQGICYFAGRDAEFGAELWRSDGTLEGTYRLTDLGEGIADAIPLGIVGFQDAVYFWMGDENLVQMYVVETGSDEVTLSEELTPCTPITSFSMLDSRRTVAGGVLYFRVRDKCLRKKVSKDSPSEIVKEFEAVPYGFRPTDNSLFLFSNSLLWRMNLETEEIVSTLFPDFFAVPIVTYPSKDLIVFSNNLTLGDELWVSDGTEEGTKVLRKFLDFFTTTNPEYLTYFKDKVYLSVGDRYNAPDFSEVLGEGRELWATDGTEEGTEIVIDIREGVHHSNVRHIVATSDYLYFIADFEEDKQGLYQSDGTAEGTILIDESISKPEFNFPNLSVENLFAVGDKVIMFTETVDAEDGDGELQIWASTIVNNIEANRLGSFKVVPNPFSQQTSLSFSERLPLEISFQLYNSIGQKVTIEYAQKPNEILIERGDLEMGMYFFEVKEKGEVVGNGKLMINN